MIPRPVQGDRVGVTEGSQPEGPGRHESGEIATPEHLRLGEPLSIK